MEPGRGSLTPIGGGRVGADQATGRSRRRIELPPAERDDLLELAGTRERGPVVDDGAPKTSPATAAFVSRLRDILTVSCYFSVVSGFLYGPISSMRDAYWSPGPLPSDSVSQTPQRTVIGRIDVHTPSDWHRLRRRMPERRERRAQPVCRHAAHGAFTIRHARLHVQTVLDEIVARAALTDAPSGTGRLPLRLLLRLSSADSPRPPDDHQELFGTTATGLSAL
jgi:hypothetical protein